MQVYKERSIFSRQQNVLFLPTPAQEKEARKAHPNFDHSAAAGHLCSQLRESSQGENAGAMGLLLLVSGSPAETRQEGLAISLWGFGFCTDLGTTCSNAFTCFTKSSNSKKQMQVRLLFSSTQWKSEKKFIHPKGYENRWHLK